MPPIGITEPQILAAIEALQARGEAVTKITVRKELGDTGSFGTISAFLQRWKQDETSDSPEPVQPIPESIQALFAKAWAGAHAQAQAQAELAPVREAMAQETAALKAEMARAQEENDEAIRSLELQLENHAAQLTEAAAKEDASQARLAALAENLGYLKAKLEAAEGSEAAGRKQLTEKESRLREVEEHLREAQARLDVAEKALQEHAGRR
jgi:chromosome segregation ATPase